MKSIMNPLRAAAVLLAFAAAAFADSPAVDSVTTLDGKATYINVHLLRFEGDVAVITHSSGLTRVPIEQLPDNARVAFGMRTLAEEKAYAAEQQSKGLLKYKGEWLTPLQQSEKEADDKADELMKKKNERQVAFAVAKSLPEGAICRRARYVNAGGYSAQVYDGEVFFLYGQNNKTLVDGEKLKKDLFWCGTFELFSPGANPASQTVNSYATDVALARGIVRRKFAIVPGRPSGELGDAGRMSGSGFVACGGGYIVTCNHVVEGARTVRVQTEGGMLQAQVVATDPNTDLALLKVARDLEPMALSSQASARLGQTVFTVGFPMPEIQGSSPKVTKGVVSSLAGIHDDPQTYQIDAAIQPGNSGGPLADDNGNLVGVVASKLTEAPVVAITGQTPQNVNYAVKLSCVLAMLKACPDAAPKIKVANDRAKLSFEDAVEKVRKATVLVLANK